MSVSFLYLSLFHSCVSPLTYSLLSFSLLLQLVFLYEKLTDFRTFRLKIIPQNVLHATQHYILKIGQNGKL